MAKKVSPQRPPSMAIGYLAGLIDAGSSIDIQKTKKKSGIRIYIPRLRLNSKRLRSLQYVRKTFNLKEKIEPQNYKVRGKTRKSYTLSINKRDSLKAVLPLVRNRVIAKHRHVEILLQFIKHRDAQQPILKKLASKWAVRKRGQTTYTSIDEGFYKKLKRLNSL